jgi:hypothetical protein
MRIISRKKVMLLTVRKEGGEEAKKICCLNTMLIPDF